MSQSNSRYDTTFINISGGILTEQLVRKLREQQCSEEAVNPVSFMIQDDGPTTQTAFETEVSEVWESLKERWDSLSQDNEIFSLDTSEIRQRWSIPLLEQLGFDPVYQQSNLEASGIEANLSHLGWSPQESVQAADSPFENRPPVLHMTQPDGNHPLDDGDHAGTGVRGKSPHDELQTYLNANSDVQWSVVTDGLKLRVLREFYHTYTRGYVEFDLENIFTNRNFNDFRALYRLCHASRFTSEAVDDEQPVESLYQVSIATGVKIGEDLQSNVIEALETLGNGFLTPEIREQLDDGGQDVADAYYQDQLRIVYRLLFLLFAEQRGMMADRGGLYTNEYSVSALRERAERNSVDDSATDLWEGLQVTFDLVGKGCDDENLRISGYNGSLFNDENLSFVDTATCPNQYLLDAVHNLTHVEQEGYQQRISYGDLGVEEIGSVYESLLEFTPKLADGVTELEDRGVSLGEFYLDDRGTERKETGSYYTDPGLVRELVQSALKPVVENRLEDVTTAEQKEDTLLNISVCDPASGSGAFLIAANNFLAQRLARIRSDSEYPIQERVRDARRDVLQQCIYAVDLNPMAVELTKVSLWINSAVEDKPLNFLDHHIKCGNSLIGTNSELLEDEFPVDAYETSGGRDWHVGNEIRKRVRSENRERSKDSSESSLRQWGAGKQEYVSIAKRLDKINEENTEDIDKKKQIYSEVQKSESYQQEKLAYDAWTAGFYWPMDGSTEEYPSPSVIEKIRRNPNDEAIQDLIDRTKTIAKQQRFFHWELEFPEIFSGDSPGFDCILGNPPWDKLKLEEKEWFAGRVPEIAESDSKGQRTKLINELEETDQFLYEQWQLASRRSAQTSKFIRESGRYPLSGSGEINTYPIFTELTGLQIIGQAGRAGMVVKTGLATDYRTQDLFGKFVEDRRLVSLHDFVNEEGLFPDVAPPERFCLLTLAGSNVDTDAFEFSFFSTNLEMMRDESRRYELTQGQIESINPNTKGCPTFPNSIVRDITVDIYDNVPVLVNKQKKTNPWGLKYQTLYHMTNDTSDFENYTKEELEEKGYQLSNNSVFQKQDHRYLPLYEAKFIHQFDHRFGSFEGIDRENRFVRKAQTKRVSDEEKKDPTYETIPRYWVEESELQSRVSGTSWEKDWVFTFRGITNTTTNFRTAMGAITPFYGFGNSAPVLTFDSRENLEEDALLFTSFFTSFPFDFALRQSVGGANLNLYILEQMPIPAPEKLSMIQVTHNGESESLRSFLVHHALRLTWTSNSLDSLGKEVEPRAGPFVWDKNDRRERRAKIDAAIAHTYELNRDQFEYILDSFDILKQREIDEHGEYLRKLECLEAYGEISVSLAE